MMTRPLLSTAMVGFSLLSALASLEACSGADSASGGTSSSSGAGGAAASSSSSGMPDTDGGADATPDAGRDLSSDKMKFFGSSRCATAGVQLCEDFESGTLDPKTWTVSGTAPVIDGVQHARGQKALHITQNGNGLSYIKETKTFPAPNNTYYGRAFVYWKALPTPSGAFTYAHWTFIAASGTGVTGEIRVSGQLQNGKNFFGVGTDSGGDPNGTGDWTNSDKDPMNAPVPVPTGQWLCIEWMHKGDTNETRFFWDAIEHPSLYTSAKQHGGNGNDYLLPTFNNVWIGWQEYQTTSEPFEMWVDEIAIDWDRIGCVL
jgi:hypothetical protein